MKRSGAPPNPPKSEGLSERQVVYTITTMFWICVLALAYMDWRRFHDARWTVWTLFGTGISYMLYVGFSDKWRRERRKKG
jgi:uncharacterized membrane protein YhaH (DUF805 family)